MKTERINNTNFQGKLIVSDNLSNKPEQSVNKAGNEINRLISAQDFDIYIKQDYTNNEVNMLCKPYYDDNKVQISIPNTAGSNKYIASAKKIIADYKNKVKNSQSEEYKKATNLEELKDTLAFIAVLLPLAIIGLAIEDIKDCNKLIKNMLNKAKILATKKG